MAEFRLGIIVVNTLISALVNYMIFKSGLSDLKCSKLQNNNLLTIRAAENVVRILPPLNVKKSEIDISLKIIKKVCKEFK